MVRVHKKLELLIKFCNDNILTKWKRPIKLIRKRFCDGKNKLLRKRNSFITGGLSESKDPIITALKIRDHRAPLKKIPWLLYPWKIDIAHVPEMTLILWRVTLAWSPLFPDSIIWLFQANFTAQIRMLQFSRVNKEWYNNV